MPISLKIEITSPLDSNDHDLLSGIAVMVLAIANHELARERFPEGFPGEEDPAPERPETCGDLEVTMEPNGPTATGRVCISDVGHRGRHRYRGVNDFIPAPAEGGLN